MKKFKTVWKRFLLWIGAAMMLHSVGCAKAPAGDVVQKDSITLYDTEGNPLPTNGTVYPTAENLECYLAIMNDGFGNGDKGNPMFVAYGYSCEYQPGLAARSADLSFDIEYAFGATEHVHFIGEAILSDEIPVPSPIPFDAVDWSHRITNVSGSITF